MIEKVMDKYQYYNGGNLIKSSKQLPPLHLLKWVDLKPLSNDDIITLMRALIIDCKKRPELYPTPGGRDPWLGGGLSWLYGVREDHTFQPAFAFHDRVSLEPGRASIEMNDRFYSLMKDLSGSDAWLLYQAKLFYRIVKLYSWIARKF